MKTQQVTNISRRRKLLFSLIIVFLFWLFSDTVAYILLQKISKSSKYQVFHGFQIPITEELARPYTWFHPQWGWDISKGEQGQLGNRKSHEYERKEEYKIKVFGDSFTYGVDVRDNETFEYFAEEKTNWEWLNYGVPAFGTDQALLKYKDTPIKTTYTLLCILDENIGRCVNIWRRFYYKSYGVKSTKPRFAISDRNSIVLVENPIRDNVGWQKLADVQFINSLKKYDYWANYWEKINSPYELKWPATLTILPHFNFFVRESMTSIRNNLSPTYESMTSQINFYHLYNNDSEGIRIMRYIVNEFISTTHLRGEIPIIVIFPITHSVDIFSQFDRKPYQSLVDYLEDIQCHFVDFGDIFVREEYIDYYQSHGGHFSVAGNKKIADELIDYIQQLEHE